MMMIPQSDDIDNVPRFWVTPLLIRREERERERVIYKIRYFGEIFLLLWSLVLKKFLVCDVRYNNIFPFSFPSLSMMMMMMMTMMMLTIRFYAPVRSTPSSANGLTVAWYPFVQSAPG